MRKALIVALFLICWASPALAGHIEILYQDGSREALQPAGPVGEILVIMEPQSMIVQYRDGTQEFLQPDPGNVVTAVNIYIDGEADGHADVYYTDGSTERLMPTGPVRRVDVIVSQRFMNIEYMDGRSEIEQPDRPVRQVGVVLY